MDLLNRIKYLALNPIYQNTAVILTASLISLIVSYLWLFPTIQKDQDNVVTNQYHAALRAQDLLQIFLKLRTEDLANLGQLLIEYPTIDNSLVQSYFKSHSDVISLALINSTGSAVLSEINQEKRNTTQKETSFANTRLFNTSIKGQTYYSPVYLDEQGPLIRISTPINKNNTIVGIVTSEIDMSLIREIVLQARVENGKVYIVDSLGTIIADPDLKRSNSGDNLAYRGVVKDMIEGKEQVSLAIYTNEDKIKVLSYGLRFPLTGWGIIVEQDYQKAFQQRERTTVIALSYLLISAVFIILLLTGSIRLTRALVNIRAERNKLSLTLSSIADAIIAVDLDNNIIIFNQAAEKLTGYTESDVLNKPIDKIIHLFDHDEEITSTQYSPFISEEKEGVVFTKKNLKLVGAQGKERYIDIVSGHIKNATEAHVGCILTLHDITEEMQFEKMKLDFVSMAAHELRTPLTVIRSYLSVLMKELLDQLSPEYKTFLSRISISAQQLNYLIENLLNVSNIEKGTINMTFSNINLQEYIMKAVESLHYQAKEKNITLTFLPPVTQLPLVRTDQVRITEVIDNLISNAIKYTEQNGKVDVWMESTGAEVITHIKDTGVGIPEEAIPHLFTKFFRVWSSLEMTSGTGLGLYISKAIVEKSNGRIWVESKPSVGSTFSFALPIVKTELAHP